MCSNIFDLIFRKKLKARPNQSDQAPNNFGGYRFTQIRKRRGQLVLFDHRKFESAVLRAGRVNGEFDEDVAGKLAIKVLSLT